MTTAQAPRHKIQLRSTSGGSTAVLTLGGDQTVAEVWNAYSGRVVGRTAPGELGYQPRTCDACDRRRGACDEHSSARPWLPLFFRLWDGHGGYAEVPGGTIVGCNQIGHNYAPHMVNEYCLVGGVASEWEVAEWDKAHPGQARR